MTQRRMSGGSHVVYAGGEATLEERSNLRGEQDRLSSSWRGANPAEALAQIGSIGTIGVSREHYPNGVVLHVPRDGHTTHELHHLKDGLLVEDGLRPLLSRAGREIEDGVEL